MSRFVSKESMFTDEGLLRPDAAKALEELMSSDGWAILCFWFSFYIQRERLESEQLWHKKNLRNSGVLTHRDAFLKGRIGAYQEATLLPEVFLKAFQDQKNLDAASLNNEQDEET